MHNPQENEELEDIIMTLAKGCYQEAVVTETTHKISELNKMRTKLDKMREYRKISETAFNEIDTILFLEVCDLFSKMDEL